MQITTETFGDVLVAHTPDELIDETISLFVGTLEESLDSGVKKFVIQMDRTDIYDSVGLDGLAAFHEKVLAEGGNLKVSGLVDTGRRIFEITRLDQQFDVFDSVIDAVSSYQ